MPLTRPDTPVTIIAWDIETCPYPLEELTPAQRHRYEMELERTLSRRPELTEEEASGLVRSLHPHLGWICTISAVAGSLEAHRDPSSWTAAEPAAEQQLLEHFWRDLSAFRSRPVVWVTFNGKRFDVPFLLARTVRYRMVPSRYDLLNTHPYRFRPHADLMMAYPMACSLDDLCDHLGVRSSKSAGMNGGHVAASILAGQLDVVREYCERDVVATYECFQAMSCLLEL